MDENIQMSIHEKVLNVLLFGKIQTELQWDSTVYPPDWLKFKINPTLICMDGDEEWLQLSYTAGRIETGTSTLENN